MSDDTRFDRCLAKLLDLEQGYSNRASDKGGETNYGISKRWFPEVDVARLTPEKARAIYREKFWLPAYDQLRDEALASELFEAAVNCGPSDGHAFLQRALCALGARVEIDGALGPKTLAAANGYRHPRALLMAYRVEAGIHYRAQNDPVNYAGWLHRLAA